MPLQMMDAQHRFAPGQAQAGGEARSHQKSAYETGSRSVGNTVDRLRARLGIGKRLPEKGQKAPNMVPRGQFRHHPSVGLVHRDLAVKPVGQQSQVAVIDRHRRLIARAFNADYTHTFC